MESIFLTNPDLPITVLLVAIISIMIYSQRRRDGSNDKRLEKSQAEFIDALKRRDTDYKEIVTEFIALQRESHSVIAEQTHIMEDMADVVAEQVKIQKDTASGIAALRRTIRENRVKQDADTVLMRSSVEQMVADVDHLAADVGEVRKYLSAQLVAKPRVLALQRSTIQLFRKIIVAIQTIEELAPRAASLEASTLVLQQATSLHHVILTRLSEIERKIQNDQKQISDDVGAADVPADADADGIGSSSAGSHTGSLRDASERSSGGIGLHH